MCVLGGGSRWPTDRRDDQASGRFSQEPRPVAHAPPHRRALAPPRTRRHGSAAVTVTVSGTDPALRYSRSPVCVSQSGVGVSGPVGGPRSCAVSAAGTRPAGGGRAWRGATSHRREEGVRCRAADEAAVPRPLHRLHSAAGLGSSLPAAAAASPLSRRPGQPGPWGAAGRAQAQARGAGGVSIKYIAFQEKKNGHVRNAARGAPKSRADQ